MIVNGETLLKLAPILGMKREKIKESILASKKDTIVTSSGLSEGGYDIRIRQTIRFYKKFWFFRYVDVTHENGKTETKRGRFTLASAIETFAIPPNLIAVVHDKSTWARCGLSVFNTVLEPAWGGGLTLELVYHGTGELEIAAGSGIAQVLFSEVKHPAYYKGKYMWQGTDPTPARSR